MFFYLVSLALLIYLVIVKRHAFRGDLTDDDVSFYNSTASTWTLATPRTTWETDILVNPITLVQSSQFAPQGRVLEQHEPRAVHVPASDFFPADTSVRDP